MVRLLGLILFTLQRVSRRLRMVMLRPLFGSYGRNFLFDPDGSYSFSNIYVGDDVSLGWKPVLMAALSEIHIGSHVMFGPEVVLIGGGHNITIPDRFMTQVHEKTGNEDLGVTIEDDVWVGTRAVILRGVTIGRGSVVGAGSVVTKSVPPYAIAAGNPARVVRYRWDVETIMAHESALYPLEQRLLKSDLERWQSSNDMLAPRRVKVG